MSTTHRLDQFDFRKSVAYDSERKQQFHNYARRQLRKLATRLGLLAGDYDLRTNRAGIAVSGEITLHADRLYVQVSQPFGGFDSGVMFRTCKGCKDYVGGPNNFASLDLLHEPQELAFRIRNACRF